MKRVQGLMGLVAAVLMCGAAGQVAPAAVLLSDNFDPNPAASSYSTNGGTLSLVNDAAGLASGNALDMPVKANGSGFLIVQRSLPSAVNLGIGQALTVSLDFRFTSGPESVASGFRVGFGNDNESVKQTLFGVLSTGGTNGATIFHAPTFNIGGTGLTNVTSNSSIATLNDQTAHHAVFTLARIDAVTLVASFTVDSRNLTGNVPLALQIDGFNKLLIGTGGNVDSLRVDNVVVSLISVPAPAALGGGLSLLGVMGLSRRRR